MTKITVCILLIIFSPFRVYGFASGSGTCEIDANYTSITSMGDRAKNFNKGSYIITTDLSHYIPSQPVQITLSGPEFTGILFKLVDENGNEVGTFDAAPGVVNICSGSAAMVITHSGTFGNMTDYSLFWIPPSNNVGKVYILAYVLKGTRGATGSQEFFRFVRDDDSAVMINVQDIFTNSFE